MYTPRNREAPTCLTAQTNSPDASTDEALRDRQTPAGIASEDPCAPAHNDPHHAPGSGTGQDNRDLSSRVIARRHLVRPDALGAAIPLQNLM